MSLLDSFLCPFLRQCSPFLSTSSSRGGRNPSLPGRHGGSCLPYALRGWKMLGCKTIMLVAEDPRGLWGDASWKRILEAADESQHQVGRHQGPLTSGKDTQAPQLLSVVS